MAPEGARQVRRASHPSQGFHQKREKQFAVVKPHLAAQPCLNGVQVCGALPACAGFNAAGWLKSSLGVTVAGDGALFSKVDAEGALVAKEYNRTQPVCPVVRILRERERLGESTFRSQTAE